MYNKKIMGWALRRGEQFLTIDERLPVFYDRKVAKEKADELNCRIVRVVVGEVVCGKEILSR